MDHVALQDSWSTALAGALVGAALHAWWPQVLAILAMIRLT
jgi:hypothetical protein